MNETTKGSILVLITATCFGLTPSLAKLVYSQNVNPEFMLAARFSIAAFVLWLYNTFLSKKEKVKVNNQQLLILFFIGGVIYFLTTMFYFNAIVYIPVSLHIMIFYLYPFLLNIFVVIAFKEKLMKKQIVIMFIAFVGIVMMVWSPGIYINGIGVVLSLLAMIGNGSYMLFLDNKKLKNLDSITVTTFITMFSALSFITYCLFTGKLHFSTTILGWFGIFVIAVICTAVAMISLFLGINKIGPTKAGIISTFELIVGIILSVIVLKEKLYFMQIIGAILIITAIIVMNLTKSNTSV